MTSTPDFSSTPLSAFVAPTEWLTASAVEDYQSSFEELAESRLPELFGVLQLQMERPM